MHNINHNNISHIPEYNSDYIFQQNTMFPLNQPIKHWPRTYALVFDEENTPPQYEASDLAFFKGVTFHW